MNAVLGAINDFSQTCGNYCYETQQAGLSGILKLKEMRNHPDIYQKIGQLAHSSLQFMMMMNIAPGAKLAELSVAIAGAVGMHDFYRVVQYPRHWFFPVNAESIDEDVVLKDLVSYLIASVPVGKPVPHEGELRAVVQQCLKAQLELMADKDDAYRNLGEFIGQLEKRLRKEDQDWFVESGFSGLKQSEEYDLTKWFRHVPTLEKITNISWVVADVLANAWWLGVAWNIVNLDKCAETIGQYRAFAWVKNQNLETCLIGSVCVGFAWRLLESVRKLRDEKLSDIEKRQMEWNTVTDATNLVFFGAIFTNMISQTKINNTWILALSVGARSLGLLSLLIKPKREFFEIS